MNTAEDPRLLPSPIPIALMIGVYSCSIYLSFTTLLQIYPELAIGVTYDLALSAPFFYYLAIRKTRIPKITVAAVFSVGLLTAFYLLPPENLFHAELLAKTVIPAVEISVACLIGIKAYKAVRIFKKKSAKSHDIKPILENVCEELMGKSRLAKAVAFEASIVAYAFLPMRVTKSEGHAFSYFKLRGTNALYGVSGFIIAAETIVFHFILARWSVLAAWILTASSMYVMMILFAQFRAVRKRPIEILRDAVIVRCGLFCEATIPLDDIESVTSLTGFENEGPETYQAALLGSIESMNVLMTLKREATAYGPYWTKKTFRKMAFFVDRKDEFIKLVCKHDTD